MTNGRFFSATEFREFLRGYRKAMLWANALTYHNGELVALRDPDSVKYCPARIRIADARECYAFLTDCGPDIESQDIGTGRHTHYEMCGHNFALSRNGHGAGFFDYGYRSATNPETTALHEWGQRMQAKAKTYGSATYVVEDSDDGMCVADIIN